MKNAILVILMSMLLSGCASMLNGQLKETEYFLKYSVPAMFTSPGEYEVDEDEEMERRFPSQSKNI